LEEISADLDKLIMQRKEKLKRVFQYKCTHGKRRKNVRYSRLGRKF